MKSLLLLSAAITLVMMLGVAHAFDDGGIATTIPNSLDGTSREHLLERAFADETTREKLIESVRRRYPELLQKLLTRPRDLRVDQSPTEDSPPAPTPMCEMCLNVTNQIFPVLANHTAIPDELIQWVLNVACAEFTKDSEDGKLCMDIVDFLLKELENLDDHLVFKVHFNMSVIACADLLPVCEISCCLTDYKPEQIFIGYPTHGDVLEDGKMQVTWTTYEKVQTPVVKYWKKGGEERSGVNSVASNAKHTTYTVAGWKGNLYSAVMEGLEPGVEYSYVVGDASHTSSPSHWLTEPYNFTMLPSNVGTPERQLRVAALADMGIGGRFANASKEFETVAQLQKLVNAGQIDLIIHGGDVSYADADQYRWDRYMRQMEPIIARVPYMLVPGNHECPYNFTAYRTRFFGQPRADFGAPNDAMYYSFTVGKNIRFIQMDSEDPINLPLIGSTQQDWVKKVFATPGTNKQFIFTTFHRPMYCTSAAGPNCAPSGLFMKYIQNELEETLVENNVAIVHTGHIHNYERTFQVYKNQKMSESYENTSYPVNFVNGAPGCPEGLSSFGHYEDPFIPRPAYSAKRIRQTSFMMLQIHSEEVSSSSSMMMKHTANITQYASNNMEVLDHIVLTKYL